MSLKLGHGHKLIARLQGGIIQVSQDKIEAVEDGHPEAAAEAVTVYTVTQVPRAIALPKPVKGPQHRYEFKWDFGPAQVSPFSS